jgi:signal transduction histidine kinase/ligand-binding sensor domain-containing protein
MSRAGLGRSVARSGAVAGVCLLATAWAGERGLGAETAAPEFAIRSWDTRDGLPVGAIAGIERSRNGYLWLATRKGLVRFDGTRFRLFDSQDIPQLRTNLITSLRADSEGRLWFGTPDGLFEFPGVGPEPTAVDEVGAHLDVSLLAAGGKGTVWALTGSRELMRIRGQRLDGRCVIPEEAAIRSTTCDEVGNVWVAAGTNLYTAQGDQAVKWTGGGTGQYQIDGVTPSRDGGLWVASGRRAKLLSERQGFVAPSMGWDSTDAPETPITALLEDRSGRLWVGARGGGVHCFERGAGWRLTTPRRSRSIGAISCLYEDAEGSIWAGTSAGLLHQIRPRLLTTWSLPAPAQESVPQTVCVGRDGAVWVGTDGAGAFRCDRGAFAHFGAEEGLSNLTVITIFEDRQSNLWLGTLGGLYRLERGRLRAELEAEFAGKPVPALFEDQAGDLWCGGVGIVVRKHGQQVFAYKDAALRKHEVRAITEGKPGEMWIGTRGGGLFRLQSERLEKEEAFGWPSIMALHYDGDGLMWVGTLNNGLVCLHGKEARHWTTIDGLPNNTFYAILEDGAGRLWVSCNEGVFGMSKQALGMYQKGLTEPLPCQLLALTGAETWGMGSGQPAASKGPDGRLWFPVGHGVLSFDPAVLADQGASWPVLVEEAWVDGLRQPLAGADPLRIRSGTRRLELRYALADLCPSGRLRFQYELEGFEDKWVDAGEQRTAYYGYLPPGRYRFNVISCGSRLDWEKLAQPLLVEVVPRFWEGLWFQCLCGLVLLAAVGGSVRAVERAKTRRRLERLELQQTMEKERLRIARDLHDDLGSGLTEIMLLGEVARRESPAAGQAQIGIITDKARRLAAAMDEVVWTVNPKNDTVPNLASYLSDYAREFFSAASMRCRIDMADALPASPLPAQARHGLLLAVKEALNNAAKHSGATEVWLRIRCEAGELRVEVEDNGRGFDASAVTAGGNGLDNLRARLAAVGGQTEIISRPGRGTTVRLRLPLESAESLD